MTGALRFRGPLPDKGEWLMEVYGPATAANIGHILRHLNLTYSFFHEDEMRAAAKIQEAEDQYRHVSSGDEG